MNKFIIIFIVFLFLPKLSIAWGESESERKYICEDAKRNIKIIQKRMRKGYTAEEYNYLMDDLRDYKKKRSEYCDNHY